LIIIFSSSQINAEENTIMDCPPGWQYDGNLKCLYYNRDMNRAVYSWIEAHEVCNVMGAHLTEIETEVDYALIKSYLLNLEHSIGKIGWFIGLSDQANEGNWRWYDNRMLLNVSHWMDDHPNTNPENQDDCVLLNENDYKFRDTNCYDEMPMESPVSFICEKTSFPIRSFINASCEDTSDELRYIVTSENYPENYNPNSKCEWNISLPLGFRVGLNFRDFDLKLDEDFLEIYDGDNKIGSYTGSHIPQAKIESTGNSLSLQFSGNQNPERGFDVRFYSINDVIYGQAVENVVYYQVAYETGSLECAYAIKGSSEFTPFENGETYYETYAECGNWAKGSSNYIIRISLNDHEYFTDEILALQRGPFPVIEEERGCRKGGNFQTFQENKMVGCDGDYTNSTFRTACAVGWHVATATDYFKYGGTEIKPSTDRWVDVTWDSNGYETSLDNWEGYYDCGKSGGWDGLCKSDNCIWVSTEERCTLSFVDNDYGESYGCHCRGGDIWGSQGVVCAKDH